jgi:GcrA cell cycle regulator
MVIVSIQLETAMAWTEERVEQLKKLWSEGLSASQIATRLGEVTRNAVIGKVHRLGLAGRASVSRPKGIRPRKAVAARPAGAKRPKHLRYQNPSMPREGFTPFRADGVAEPYSRTYEELVIPLEERASILSLKETSCRWPIGDPQHDEFHFCGKSKLDGLPYCDFHARRAFQPAQSRRREPALPMPTMRLVSNG